MPFDYKKFLEDLEDYAYDPKKEVHTAEVISFGEKKKSYRNNKIADDTFEKFNKIYDESKGWIIDEQID